MFIFNGYQLAYEKERKLKEKINFSIPQKSKIVIASLVFKEDFGSCLYANLKNEMALRVGIDYKKFYFSLNDNFESIKKLISKLNQDSLITGIIIQKPSKICFLKYYCNKELKFIDWWKALVSCLALKKDVDGLHPETLLAIKNNTFLTNKIVLPATCRAVLSILEECKKKVKNFDLSCCKIVILGKSDLLGKPLYFYFLRKHYQVNMIGSLELKEMVASGQKLLIYDVVITATGRKHLIKAKWLKKNVVIIDVGEPRGDVDPVDIQEKASFLTPVPGGVGPMTVVSLLENSYFLFQCHSSENI